MQGFLASIFRTHRQVVCLGTHNDATVAMLTHEHNVRTVDNHLFMIESLLDEDFERFLSLFWCFLDGRLNALATLHHSIENAFIHFWHHTQTDGAIFICTLRRETDIDFVLRIILLCPCFIERIKLCRSGAIPSIAVSAFRTDVFQTATRNAIAVANVRQRVFQIVVASP